MANIRKLYEADQTTQLMPQTHEKAVVDNNGTTAETKFQMITDLVQQAQMEVGAVPSDLTPTKGSTNWVTSGGVFSALNNVEYVTIYDDNAFSFSTTSSVKSAYYIRAILFELGKTYRLTFTLDSAKSTAVDLYLANTSNRSSSSLRRSIIGSITAGDTTKTITYTCSDAELLYPSINCESATSGTLSILVEEEKKIILNEEIENIYDSIEDLYITKEVETTDSDGTEISGYNISSTTWTSESSRKIQRISVSDCTSITITSQSGENMYAAYSFLTQGVYGQATPVYYCKGYTGWVTVPSGETVTVDVPPLAKYIIIYKSYGNTSFFPSELILNKKVNPSNDTSEAIEVINEISSNVVDVEKYGLLRCHITSGSNPKWYDDSNEYARSIMIPLENGTYKIEAVNGVAIYAVLSSASHIAGETPNWATGYGQRYTVSYGGSATINAQEGWFLCCRADQGAPSESSARCPKISYTSAQKAGVVNERFYSDSDKPFDTVIVAASDSSEYDKRRANLVCTGTADNKVIESAINMIAGRKGTVYLCNGTYYVTTFTLEPDGTYVGIIVQGKNQYTRQINIEGYHFGGATNGSAKIMIPEDTYNSLDANSKYSIIRHKYGSNGFNLNYHLSLKHLSFIIYGNQKKITAIDCSCTSQINMEDISGSISTQAGVWGNAEQQAAFTPASINCVFFRGLFGSGNAWSTIKDCYCECFGIGFGIQGEHLISESCGAVNCIYGFAFNYFQDIGASAGMYVHPMIVINPIEEGCFNYPYFGSNPQKQSIIITGYHNEHRPFFFSSNINDGGNVGGNYATEKVQGQWFGHVDYAIQYFSDSQSHGNESHVADIPFWANGSGINMESKNMVHKKITNTTERNTYAPNYGQQVFDTTKNKLLICTNPTNKTWVDANGNVV